MIHAERVTTWSADGPADGRYVLYWMQASQRADWNHALDYAVSEANRLKLPLVAYFGLTERYPGANARHYQFLLEGLAETSRRLADRGVRLVVRRCDPPEGAINLASEASLVVMDRGYLRHQRRWRGDVAAAAPCPCVEVESDAVLPVELASGKEEYAARTIRPRIAARQDEFLIAHKPAALAVDSLAMSLDGEDLSDPASLMARLDVDRSIGPVAAYRGGAHEAERRLERFLDRGLARYDADRNDPTLDGQSGLSPYLHFGQISPLQVAMRVRRRGGEGARAFLEELIVRRELAMNFVWYNERYDSLAALPDWARNTLDECRDDRREYVYGFDEFEAARTHDPYWNAAQRQMVLTGKMHGYMRMYWGKKVIEWTETPKRAHEILIALNDRYELDGRDPSGYANVLWCFGKHDRPWKRRPVFGTVRYMNDAGLRRKFDADAYVRSVEQLEESHSIDR